jgi:branched-chain amino acid transport system permease protein
MKVEAAPAAPEAPVRFRPGSGGVAARIFVLAVIGAVVLGSPYWVPGDFTNLVSRAAIFGIVALSMNIIVGYTGQVSLGHVAFLGLGSYGAGNALVELGMPYGAALVVSALVAGIAALVLGIVALRVTGLYLALVTIVFGLTTQESLFNIRALTGGGAGQQVPRPSIFESDRAFAYFCIGMLALALFVDWRLVASKAGRAIQALRDDENVAASWAINITTYKVAAFVLSGAMCGVAGALFGSMTGVVAVSDFPIMLSLTFLLMTVVGGVGNRWGVVQGGIVFAVLPTLLDQMHDAWNVAPFTWLSGDWEAVIGAVLLILTLTLFPGGIAQQQEHLQRWLAFKPFHEGHSAGPPGEQRGS